MWSDLPVDTAILSCTAPFSFYFDLIAKIWRNSDTIPLPLHRLCTLARKQGAVTIVIESAAAVPRVRDEIDYLDTMYTQGGSAEALSISFFAQAFTEGEIDQVSPHAFLGRAIVINYRRPGAEAFTHTYVYEAILPPPRLPSESGGALLLNNYLATQKSFDCEVLGRTFDVSGIYYCQQNEATHVCAHACLRMAITAGGGVDITAKQINELVQQTPPCKGLQMGDLVAVLEDRGFETDNFKCEGVPRETYLSVLASIIESGDQALLVFTTGNSEADHVILVYGHTRHSDEWHPQAMPLYAGVGSARYLQAAAWIDHYLVHDDNLGPYYTMSSQALDIDPDIRLRSIMAIRQQTPNLSPIGAEGIAAVMLTNMLGQVKDDGAGRWFEYITAEPWRFVLRTILTTREDYITHLASLTGHDASHLLAPELEKLQQLPERIWMVEFSLPALFTGNRTKLGEVLLDADPVEPEEFEDVFLGMRLPSLLVVKGADGQMATTPSSLMSHAPFFRRTANGQEW